MRVAVGIKAHSGWAALVRLGAHNGRLFVVERCRMVLVEAEDASPAASIALHGHAK